MDTLPNFDEGPIVANCVMFLLLASMNVNAWVAAGMCPRPRR